MPSPFESKVLLWAVLGPILFGLAATFVYVNFIAKDSPQLAVSKSQPHAPDLTSKRETLPEARVTFDEGMNGSYSTAVAMVVKSKIKGVKYCFERQLKDYPNLGGQVVVAWTIDISGDVVEYNIESSTVDNPEVGECMLRMIRRWRFPEPGGSEYSVIYPFTFKALK